MIAVSVRAMLVLDCQDPAHSPPTQAEQACFSSACLAQRHTPASRRARIARASLRLARRMPVLGSITSGQ
jgi:hypothetical protein